MKKNVAAQVISAVVVSATDGSAVTASVTITVTGDAGTQGAGAGTLTHEGGGEWSYVPTQAETNFDHIMFKFSATGAIPVGIQVYTQFPQTGDSFARIGAAGAGLTAIDLPDQTMNITGNLSGSVGSVTGAVGSVTAAVTLTGAYDFAKGTVAMTEAYAADGAVFTPAQFMYMVWSFLAEKNIASTTLTAKKLDGSTSAMTFTLDSATSPTSLTRAT